MRLLSWVSMSPQSDDLLLEGEQDGIDLVQRLPLFRTLTYDETLRLFAITREERAPAGRVVVDEDAVGQALYIIKSGRVRVRKGERALVELGPGELFGEMSLVDDVLTSAAVEVASDAELLVLPRAPFEKLLAADLGLALKVYRAFCRTLSERLRRANLDLEGVA